MIAAGIDLGGTKIEAQVFDADWKTAARRRVDTPKDYPTLVAALADQVRWCEAEAGAALPTGIGAAGLVNPATGLALTANICASGKPLPGDIAEAVGRPIPYYNDCRALALSEAVFGIGRGHRGVMSLILGTGVGGGFALDGHLTPGPTHTGGEYGHTSASAALVTAHGLPVHRCGCGRDGCIETYIAGPGLSRLAAHMTGTAYAPPDLVARRTTDPKAQATWDLWLALTADLLRNLVLTVDPDIIALGGGLSRIDGVAEDLSAALQAAQLGDFAIPPIRLAEGGDTSGARGAAYAAWQDA